MAALIAATRGVPSADTARRQALAGSYLIVPAQGWNPAQPTIPLLAARRPEGPAVLHVFTDPIAAHAALPNPVAWAIMSGPAALQAAVDGHCAAVIINPAGPGCWVIEASDLATLTTQSPVATETPIEPAPRAEIGEQRRQADELSRSAEVARRDKQYEVARTRFAEALVIRREYGDRQVAAATLNELGSLDNLLGRFDSARDALREALADWRVLGNSNGAALAALNLAWVDLHDGKPEAALPWVSEFQALGAPAVLSEKFVTLLEALAESQRQLGAPEAAMVSLEVAINVANQLPTAARNRRCASLCNDRGWLAFDAGKFDQAAIDFTDCLDHSRADGDADMLGRATLNLAWLDARLGLVEPAERRILEALELSTNARLKVDADALRSILHRLTTPDLQVAQR